MAGKSINLFAKKGKKKKSSTSVSSSPKGPTARSYASKGASKSYTRAKPKGRTTKGKTYRTPRPTRKP